MRRSITLGVLMPAVALVLTGCATKDWVRETLGKKEAEINQRVDGVETRLLRLLHSLVSRLSTSSARA